MRWPISGLVDRSITWWRMAGDAATGYREHYTLIGAARSLARAGGWTTPLSGTTGPRIRMTTSSGIGRRCGSGPGRTIGFPGGASTGPSTCRSGTPVASWRCSTRPEHCTEPEGCERRCDWYERAADVESSHVITWLRRLEAESADLREAAEWLADADDDMTAPVDVFYDVAFRGRAMAVRHAAQALAESGRVADTFQWLFDRATDDPEAIMVAAQIFCMAGQAEQAIAWIRSAASELAERVRAQQWTRAFDDAPLSLDRIESTTFAEAASNTHGAEMFDILEPRGSALDSWRLFQMFPPRSAPDLDDIRRRVADGNAEAWVDLAEAHRAAGRFEAAIDAYLQAAECGRPGLSAAVDLLRQLDRHDEADRLARFGLEPEGVIAHDPSLANGAATAEDAGVDQPVAVADAMLRRVRDGGNVLGRATLTAAAHVARCGHGNPVPTDLLCAAAGAHLAEIGIVGVSPDRIRAAIEWACEPVAGDIGPIRLHPDADAYDVSGSLIDAVVADTERRPVPPSLWSAVLEHVAPDRCWEVCRAAGGAGLPEVAERAGRRGAEAGDGLSMYVLAHLLDSHGRVEEATRWLAKAAAIDEPNAIRTLADDAVEQGRIDEAVVLYQRAIELGDWLASVQLGPCMPSKMILLRPRPPSGLRCRPGRR